jgi:hypothetical protein
MTTQYLNFRQPKQLNVNFSTREKNLFLKGFWIVCGASFWIIMTADANFISILGALIIAIAALYPSFLWCCDRAKGLPLFPLLAINYLFTHSFPLVSHNSAIAEYSPTEHFISSLAVAGFLGIATITWMCYVKEAQTNYASLKEFNPKQVFVFFTSILILGIVYQIASSSGYLWIVLPSSVVSALRIITSGLNAFAVITLSYLMGSKMLKKIQVAFFLMVMACLIFVSGASLYLNIPGFYILFASMGWMFAAKKIPWRLLVVSFIVIAFLNIGKGTTRHYYWNIRDTGVQLSEYTEVYQYWIHNSLEEIQKPTQDILGQNAIEEENQNSLANRSSVVHMLLKVQTETGTQKSYLWGTTYAIVPQLLIPRFLNPDKIRGGEANHILSVHYGLQSQEQTLTTSIGWGLLQEAYANFGWLGCLCLGAFLGNLYGWVTRWSMNVSSLSFRFLVALIFMTLAFKAEITMGIFISVIFQSLVVLSAIRMFLMKSKSNHSAI